MVAQWAIYGVYYGRQGYQIPYEMRYYLDTNILGFLLLKKQSEFSSEVNTIINDFVCPLYTSSVCMMELVHLCQIGKLKPPKGVKVPKETALLDWLDTFGVTLVPINRRHIQKLSELPLYDDHRDPVDRLIVAQAIADNAVLVSSDRKMGRYRRHGLDFVFNER